MYISKIKFLISKPTRCCFITSIGFTHPQSTSKQEINEMRLLSPIGDLKIR